MYQLLLTLSEKHHDIVEGHCYIIFQKSGVLLQDKINYSLDRRARRSLINMLNVLPIAILISNDDKLMVRKLFPRIIIIDLGWVNADISLLGLMKTKHCSADMV
jgi:hypothetical protein